MAYEVFIADTIAGKFRVAVKISRYAMPEDNRRDAYTIAIDQWGRGARLSQESTLIGRLTADFYAVASAPGWGAVARLAR